MSVTGCPADYRVGISVFLWIAFFILMILLGIFFLRKKFKNSLINQKEIYLGSGIFTIGMGIGHLFISVGVAFIDDFIFYYYLGTIVAFASSSAYVYYLERNISNLKKIPSIVFAVLAILYMIQLVYYLFTGILFSTYYVETLFLFGLIFVIPLFYLVFKFIKNVFGRIRFKAFFWAISMILIIMGGFLDHPPGCSLFNFSSLIVPILLIASIPCFYIGIGAIEGINTYYQQAKICTIHRGKISEDVKIYYCRSCGTIYCQRCYDAVIKKEGCWNCDEFEKSKFEEKLEREDIVLEIKKEKNLSMKSQSLKKNGSLK